MSKQNLLKFVLLFSITLLIVTSYFTYILSGGFEVEFQPIHVVRIIKQFGIVVALPTTLVFMGVDYLLCKKVTNAWVLQFLRAVIFFIIIYLVGLAFSGYMIVNSFFNNPLQTP